MRVPIVLASASPRRCELLKEMGLNFKICPSYMDETLEQSDLSPGIQAQYLALKKAEVVAAYHDVHTLIIGADTLVCINNQILGKPNDVAEAMHMLTMLSNQWHTVITGIALIHPDSLQQPIMAHETTRVKMRTLSFEEQRTYILTGEPMDKAGAYAIQGQGQHLIEKIEGCYTNVVGLPIPLLSKLLQEHFNLKVNINACHSIIETWNS